MSRFRRSALLYGMIVLLTSSPAAQFSTPPASLERLLQAARRGDLPGISQALAAGAPVNGGDPRWGAREW